MQRNNLVINRIITGLEYSVRIEINKYATTARMMDFLIEEEIGTSSNKVSKPHCGKKITRIEKTTEVRTYK